MAADTPQRWNTELTDAQAAELMRRIIDAREMVLWTVTTGTKDYGARYVARPHLPCLGGDAHVLACVLLADSLDALRARMPPGLSGIMERSPDDNPVVVESWI